MLRFVRNDVYAFTLAEVLVTLGIIGVVSAMTVPSLMQNYQRQSYVTQLHKVYNEVQQAALQYMTDRNALNLKEAGLTTKEAGAEWMKNYFRIVQDCSAKTSDCFAAGHYKRLNGSAIDIFDYTNVNAYVLASGAAVYVSPRADGRITFYMDINGKKGPNIIGRDVFAVMIYNNGVMDDSGEIAVTDGPLTKEQRDTLFEEHCQKGNGGYWWGCFGKILNDNWQMTY